MEPQIIPPERKLERMSFAISSSMKAKVVAFAKENGVSVGEAARQMFEFFLSQNYEKKVVNYEKNK